MYGNFEFTTNLQYKVKGLEYRVEAFETGEMYVKMREEFQRQSAAQEREIRRLKSELSHSLSENMAMARRWQEVFEDVENEHVKELLLADRRIKELEDELCRETQRADNAELKLREKYAELYQVKSELEEEKGSNQKLTAQIRRDYENSSIPSSQKPNHKLISNNREKSGKKPGGQPGHKGHCRKRLEPTKRIPIPAPDKYANSPDYKPTGKEITKQVIGIHLSVSVDEYFTPEYRNLLTGQRVHAEFPDGVVNEVNYDGSVKAFAFLLNSHCCVSIDKTRELLSWLTGDKLNISKGMVAGLCKEFAENTEATRKKSFADLLLSPFMHTDFTGARVNGKSAQVNVCASPDGTAMYFAREHKGHEGLVGTPVVECQNTLIHDHDITFYSYAKFHQECLDHILRYLKNSIENEPRLKWNKLMQRLLRQMIHYINDLIKTKGELETHATDIFKKRYYRILRLAKKEYEYEPPTKYYRDGYNLYLRMDEYGESHLRFLDDLMLPSNNNLAERLLRVFKRKMRQAMTFRSFEGLDYFCQCLSVLSSLRLHSANLYEESSKVFSLA